MAESNSATAVTASCLVDEECGMRIPSHSDDQRSSGLDLEDEVVTFRSASRCHLRGADNGCYDACRCHALQNPAKLWILAWLR